MTEYDLIQTKVPKPFKEALQDIAAKEYRTITALVVMALVEKYPELKDKQ